MNPVSPKRPIGWIAPGLRPAGNEEEAALAKDETLSYLSGDFRIFQLRNGNSWSMDELVTAFVAVREISRRRSTPAQILDLGTGTASVLMMLLWKYEGAQGLGVEAQERSADLARRSIAFNGLDARASIVASDFRDWSEESKHARPTFELITGTPPYFPSGTGLESSKPQCAPARFEHRGGVETYAEVAMQHLDPNGLFVMCSAANEDVRIENMPTPAMHHRSKVSVIPKRGKPPLISVHLFSPQPLLSENTTLTVRDERDQWTDEFQIARETFGLPPRS